MSSLTISGNFLYQAACSRQTACFANNFDMTIVLFMICYKRNCKHHSCAYIELLMHLGSLLSTQEARVAQGNSYASFVLSNLLRASIMRGTHAACLPFLNLTH